MKRSIKEWRRPPD